MLQPVTHAVFVTITDVQNKVHVDTVFYDSLLEQQMAEGKIREQYQGDQFVIVTHPRPDQVRSSEIKDVFYQAHMQTLIMGGINRH